MKISLSQEKKGILAIAGHVGCGHCHSHNHYIQDDSGGMATVLSLFQEATGLSLIIKDVRVKTGVDGVIEVETEGGGIGRATSRRGITLHEAKLASLVIGKEAIRTQTLVLEAFGRYYGQGIHETPVALQTAIANAALDTFINNYPEQFKWSYEDLQGSCGIIAGTVLNFEDIPVSVLATVNASIGGVGPNEDLEGNSAVGKKKGIMEELGMLDLPTIIVEGKVYSPLYSAGLEKPSFLIRADKEWDNPYVAYSILNAGKVLGYPITIREDVMARVKGGMAKQTKELGEKIVNLGLQLQKAEYSQEKINILAQLASLISEDGAGISFMTNKLHEIIGGTGMMPGTGAVVSYIVTPEYYNKYIFPFITEQDLAKFVNLVKQAVIELKGNLDKATAHLNQRHCFEDLDSLVLKTNLLQ